MLTADVVSQGQAIAQVSVFGPLGPSLDSARQAFARIALASAIGLVLGGVVLLVALRRALRPVHELADAARSVDLRDLSSRVPEPEGRDEVSAMAGEFNRMLDRIRDDEGKRQQLLAAISHELRTPLAVARGHLELLETLGPEEGQTAADTAAVARRELDRLSRIVDDLTALNAGADRADVEVGPVFAPDVIDALRDRVAGLGYADVEILDAPPVVVLGDEDRLTQALLALVVNARTHTPPGTPVSVRTESVDGHVAFRVSDTGSRAGSRRRRAGVRAVRDDEEPRTRSHVRARPERGQGGHRSAGRQGGPAVRCRRHDGRRRPPARRPDARAGTSDRGPAGSRPDQHLDGPGWRTTFAEVRR